MTDKVWHELAFGLENLGVETKKIRIKIAEIASYFGIENWFDKEVHTLSGGQKQILNFITSKRLTPKGIRTLTPKSSKDNPNYIGNHDQRSYAYHQGTVWPWLMGAYVEAYLKIFGRSGYSFIERKMIGFEEEMSNHCLGTLSELYDGNPPFTGRGAISIAMNIGEILRVLNLLDTFNPDK